MILVSFRSPAGLRLGILEDGQVLDVSALAENDTLLPRNPRELYAEGLTALERLASLSDRWAELDDYKLLESDLTLGPPVQRPGKIVCVGLNYRKHAAESGMAEPAEPVLFSKFDNSIAGHRDEIDIAGLEQVDYEAELALVIGRRGKNIPESEALSYVLGYMNANDLSERRLQFISGQWLLGKTLDGFLPIGPHLLTADAVGDPQSLPVRCWLNGELRQDSNTADMIFSVAEIISYTSRYMTLEPGDIISTGTPEGVIMGTSDKVWLKPGDEVTVETGGLGRLVNRLSVPD